jgi:uncharacterized protein (DUF2384 family)
MRPGQRPKPSPHGAAALAALTAFDLARTARVPLETAERWLAGTTSAAGTEAERLYELADVIALLHAAGLREPAVQGEWLRNPHPAFGRQAPLDVIAIGEHHRVVEYVETQS